MLTIVDRLFQLILLAIAIASVFPIQRFWANDGLQLYATQWCSYMPLSYLQTDFWQRVQKSELLPTLFLQMLNFFPFSATSNYFYFLIFTMTLLTLHSWLPQSRCSCFPMTTCSGRCFSSAQVYMCIEYEVEGSRPRGRPKRTQKEVVQKDCQARNSNKEDAMDRGRWKKLIKIG